MPDGKPGIDEPFGICHDPFALRGSISSIETNRPTGPDRSPVLPHLLSLGTQPHAEPRAARPDSQLSRWALPTARWPPGRSRVGHRAERRAPKAFLIAFLPDAVAQARRHSKPVSLLFVATDRLAAIRELHGPELTETAVRRVAGTVVKMLRASDIDARLDDGRIVVLPDAGALDLPMITEAVCKAIVEAGGATCSMPPAHRLDRHGHLPRPRPRRRLAPRGGRRRARLSAEPGPQSHRRARAGRLRGGPERDSPFSITQVSGPGGRLHSHARRDRRPGSALLGTTTRSSWRGPSARGAGRASRKNRRRGGGGRGGRPGPVGSRR
jgi:hypothetical protein